MLRTCALARELESYLGAALSVVVPLEFDPILKAVSEQNITITVVSLNPKQDLGFAVIVVIACVYKVEKVSEIDGVI